MAAEIVPPKSRELRQSTINLYNQIYNRFKNSQINNPDLLIKELRESGKSEKYIGTILSSIRYGLLNNNGKKNLIEKYNTIIYNHFNNVKNTQVTNDAGDQKVPLYADLQKNFNDYIKNKKHHKNYLRNVALLSIYMNDAPRRILDIELLHYVKTNTASKMTDKKINYYIKRPAKFVYNYYKTYKEGKPTIVNVPKDTAKYINEYIDMMDIKEGDNLFKMTKSNISNTVESILKSRINGIRRSYVNHIYKDYNIPSNQFIADNAAKMEHSFKEELNYRTDL